MQTRVVIPFFALFLTLAIGFWSPLGANQDFDFGLPLFGQEEIRLETRHDPPFNLRLLEKFLTESPESRLVHLHAYTKFVSLIRFSPEAKAKELTTGILATLESKPLAKQPKEQAIARVLMRGLLLELDKEPDPKNVKDHAFEELLLEAEDCLTEEGEYWLVKGLLFHRLKSRPNRFFAPMRPLEDLKRAAGLLRKEAHEYFVLGQAFRSLGMDEASLFLAIASYEKAAALNPGNGKLQHMLLGIYMSLHEHYQSNGQTEPFWLEEAVYKKILTLSPNNPYALNNLAYLYAEYGINRKQAQELAQSAADRVPTNPGFRDTLGWAAFKNRQYAKAEEELKKSLSLDATAYEPHYHLATVYYATNQYELAIPMFEKAVALKPESAEALNNYAYLLSELNRDIEKALEMSQRAVRLEPENPSYIDTLAWVYYRQNRLDEALKLLQKAARLAPEEGEILFHLGKVYLDLGHFTAGLDHLKQANLRSPRLPGLQRELYLGIALKGQYGALAEYHTLLGIKAHKAHLHRLLLNIVRTYQEEGEFRKSIELMRMCEQLQSGALGVNQALFPFYALDIGSGTADVASMTQDTAASAPAGIPEVVDGLEVIEEDNHIAASGTLHVEPFLALGLHIGPAVLAQVAKVFPVHQAWSRLSISVFVTRLAGQHRRFLLQFSLPNLSDRRPLEALSHYFSLFGCRAEKSDQPESARMYRFGRARLHAQVVNDSLFIGSGEASDELDLELVSTIFPPHPTGVAGMLIDWPVIAQDVPAFLHPFIGNPIWPFLRIESLLHREGNLLKESTSMVPMIEVDEGFMKLMADRLYAYKVLLLRLGIDNTMKLKGTTEGVNVEIDYDGMLPLAKRLWSIAKPSLWLLGGQRLTAARCYLSRGLFGRDPSSFAGLCPASGSISLSSGFGGLQCTKHPGLAPPPLLLDSEHRCRFSRMRIESLFRRLRGIRLKQEKKSELLKSILIEYTIEPCPKGGEFSVDDNGNVSCSHQNPGKSQQNPPVGP